MDARPQTIVVQMSDAAGPERCILLFDRSGSMSADDYRETRLKAGFDAGIEYLRARMALLVEDLITVILFDDDAEVVCEDVGLNEAVGVLSRLKAKHPIGGGTDINAGLLVAEDRFRHRRDNYRDRVVLLTDGHGGDPIRTARRLHSAGIIVDVIGIAGTEDGVAADEMRKVASTVNGVNRYRWIGNRTDLLNHFRSIATGLVRVG
jgi:Mg-chelatase subunit ChlD